MTDTVPLPPAGPLVAAPATSASVRAWALATGMAVADRGRVPAPVRAAYDAAHPPAPA